MADELQVVSALPAPPDYFKRFEDENFQLKRPPVPEGSYASFGIPYSAEAFIPTLVPDEKKLGPKQDDLDRNFRSEMQKLLQSIMANYVQLLDILIECPSQQSRKVEELEQLFVNFHSILNQFRQHQAREMVLVRLKRQKKDEQKALAMLESQMEAVRQVVEGKAAP
uniref:Mediator of RNA polymerase II transcription subunit 7 n=1 Tax=Fibrocapsa japonica TaxID=94617 RepID=A0A6U1QAX8_9STRA